MDKRQLVLVKHSLPEFREDVPAAEWHLSKQGQARCVPLAEHLSGFRLTALACSPEPKAFETAKIVSERLGIPLQVVSGLHEHQRRGAKFTDQAEFERQIERLFAEPDRLIYGEETANEAHARFAAAVESVVKCHPGSNIAIIAHGTVISLFVSHACGLDSFPLWQQLGLPSFIALELPEYGLTAIVDRVQSREEMTN